MNRFVIAIGLIASTLAANEAFAQPVYPSDPTRVTVPANPPQYERGGVYGGGADAGYDRQDRDDGHERDDGQDRDDRHRGDRGADRWSYLAAVDVNGFRDRDVIVLGPRSGRYDRLMLVPQGRRVRVRHAVVTFASGETMSVDLRGRDAGAAVIDLPGERRAVASVEVVAMGGRRGGAQVALYGERTGRGRWNRH